MTPQRPCRPAGLACALLIGVFTLAAARGTAAQPATSLEVRFTCQGCDLDEAAVRRAVLSELSAAPGAEISGALTLQLEGRQLVARHQSVQGRVLERRMSLPKDKERALQAIALLAANLVRDDAALLLAQLRPSSSASPSGSAATSAAPAASAPKAAAPRAPASVEPTPSAPLTTPVLPSPSKPAELPNGVLNVSLAHPLALHPSSDRKSFAFELGLIYGRVGAIDGLAVTSGATWIERNLNGASIGVVGTVATTARGAMLASAANVTLQSMRGVQAAAALNYAGERSAGVQAGPLNLARSYEGVQVGVLNVAFGDYTGAQVGVVNWAGKLRGSQVGVLNFAREVEGYPVGLLNFNRTGRMQVQLWTTTAMAGNLALRYLHRWFYVFYGMGVHPEGYPVGRESYAKLASQGGLGGHLPWGNFFLDVDGGYAHEGELSGSSKRPHTHVFRYRMALGWQPGRWPGLFAGVGMRHEFPQDGDGRSRPEAMLGMQLF